LTWFHFNGIPLHRAPQILQRLAGLDVTGIRTDYR